MVKWINYLEGQHHECPKQCQRDSRRRRYLLVIPIVMTQTFTYRQKPKFPKTQVVLGSLLSAVITVLLIASLLHANDEGAGRLARVLSFIGVSILVMLIIAMVALIVEWNANRRHFEANQKYSPWARPVDPSLGQGGRVWSPNSWE